MFFIFLKSCEKYKFNFVINTCGEVSVTLRPNNTFDNIYVNQGYSRNFIKLFFKSIREMKKYREERGY